MSEQNSPEAKAVKAPDGLEKLMAVRSASSTNKAVEPNRKLWLDAWHDAVAGLGNTPCVHACNLQGDGEWRLIIADVDKKLKVWKGTQKVADVALPEAATALTSFWPDKAAPRVPSVAIASGPTIYIYRNLKPYYKFAMPAEEVHADEQAAWSRLLSGEVAIGDALADLTKLQQQGVSLTSRSLQLLNTPDPDARARFIDGWSSAAAAGGGGAHHLAATPTCATCLATVNQSSDEPDAVSCLVVGTESGRVLVLNTAGQAVTHSFHIGTPPHCFVCSGELEHGYKINVAGRDGKVYTIKNGEVSPLVIQLESHCVGLARLGRDSLMVGATNNVIHSYRSNAQKNYTLYLPSPLVAMQAMEVQAPGNPRCLLAALANGEVRVYNEKALVSVHALPSPATALWFGRFSREDNTLIVASRSGALDMKILPRNARLDAPGASGPPPEQDVPLAVPKKTRLYVEQTARERDQAVAMHRTFQRDLVKARLEAARAYVKVLTDGQGAASFTSNAALSLNAAVRGLGPAFRVVLTLRNEAKEPASDVVALLQYDDFMYRAAQRQISVPLLVPGLSYTLEVGVQCLRPAAGSDSIRILLVAKGSPAPLLTALLKMPLSEMDLDG